MSLQLRVNPIVCDGHGLCAELLPERITLDDWGYPIIDPRAIDAGLEGHARRAVDACPMLALALVPATAEPVGPTAPKRANAPASRSRRRNV
jgi:ferredoxin